MTIGPSSFLLCITRREQVAQIYGKPIYLIKDVATLPISSQSDANQAIAHARASLQKGKSSQEPNLASSASEESANESFDENLIGDPADSQSHGNPGLRTAGPDETSTSVVQNVIERKGQYGRFASQWFSRREWGPSKKRAEAMSTTIAPRVDNPSPNPQLDVPELGSEDKSLNHTSQPVNQHTAGEEGLSAPNPSHEAAVQMLPKILRTTKLLLTSQSFYFSYDFNLTKRFGSASIASLRSVSPESIEQQVRDSSACLIHPH